MREVPGSIPGTALLLGKTLMYRFQSSLLDKFERVGYGIFRAGACGVVVSRLLCMQKASGSNPDKSSLICNIREIECELFERVEPRAGSVLPR